LRSEQRFKQAFSPFGFPPNRIEIYSKYGVSGTRFEGKFSVAFVDMEWATMAVQNAVDKTVAILFDPGDPEDCVPVEKNGWDIRSGRLVESELRFRIGGRDCAKIPRPC
jgi:hypothetical protein